jgi:hypothetical protein
MFFFFSFHTYRTPFDLDCLLLDLDCLVEGRLGVVVEVRIVGPDHVLLKAARIAQSRDQKVEYDVKEHDRLGGDDDEPHDQVAGERLVQRRRHQAKVQTGGGHEQHPGEHARQRSLDRLAVLFATKRPLLLLLLLLRLVQSYRRAGRRARRGRGGDRLGVCCCCCGCCKLGGLLVSAQGQLHLFGTHRVGGRRGNAAAAALALFQLGGLFVIVRARLGERRGLGRVVQVLFHSGLVYVLVFLLCIRDALVYF